MAALLPCPDFIPMYFQGEYYCSQCGFSFEYHQARQGMLFLHNVNNQPQQDHPELQLEPYPPQQQRQLANGHGVILPHNWHDLPMPLLLHPPSAPADPNHVRVAGNNSHSNNNSIINVDHNNVNNNNPEPETEPEQEDPRRRRARGVVIRSWVFTEYQIDRMLEMADRFRWSLRGHSRDAELLQFCDEIGITWSQFSNWVHRNRERFAAGNQG